MERLISYPPACSESRTHIVFPPAESIRALGPEHTQQQRDHKHHEKNVEQDFRDLSRARGNARETEDRRDNRDNEKNDSVMEHGGSPFYWFYPVRACGANRLFSS
jgi:hypothetical protein